jgi:outer membrane receptor protein involved in Fe transport
MHLLGAVFEGGNMSRISKQWKLGLLMTTGLAFGATEAFAQIEEVVVTARKREESLQSVPITVTAFSEEAITRQGIKTVNEIAKFTPGLNFDRGFAPQDTRPNIRGLPTTRGRPPIGILLDGIDISSESIGTAGGSNLMNLKLVDVERIEVVKGPQSALYGRVAFGGAINYVSKKPNLEAMESSVNVDVATYDLYEVRGATNVPLSDKAALRVNALYSYFDGFYENEVSGATIGGAETWGVAGALRLLPADNADFTLRVSYSDDKSEPRPAYYFGQFVPGRGTRIALPANAVGERLGQIPAGGGLPTTNPLPATIAYPALGEEKRGDRVLLSVDPLTGKDYEGGRLKPVIASLVGDIDFGWATLSSWTGVTRATAISRADGDFHGAPLTQVTLPTPGLAEPLPAAQVSDFRNEIKQYSQELRLGDLEGEGFRWAVGGLYWKEDYSSVNSTLFVQRITRLTPGWSVGREIQMRGNPIGELNTRNTEHYSGYGIAEFDITDQLEISAEGRYSHEKFNYLFGRSISAPISGTTLLPYTYAGGIFNPESSTNFFAPRVTVNYKPTDDASLYATYSRGVKPGGFLNVAVVFDVADALYKPEKLDNYEVGFKTSWADDTLRFNGAYFHMIYKDRLTQLLVPEPRSPQGTVTKTVNQGQAKVDGVEVEVVAAPAEGLTLTGAYTYLDPRFTESEVPTTSALDVANAGNCRIGTVGQQRVCFVNTNGNQLEQAAKHSLSAAINYTAPLSGDWNLVSEISTQYRSKRYQAPSNLIWIASNWNVDAQIGAQNDSYTVLAYVTNLLDNRKPTSAQTYGDPFIVPPDAPPVLSYATYAADKRQMGLRIGAKF